MRGQTTPALTGRLFESKETARDAQKTSATEGGWELRRTGGVNSGAVCQGACPRAMSAHDTPVSSRECVRMPKYAMVNQALGETCQEAPLWGGAVRAETSWGEEVLRGQGTRAGPEGLAPQPALRAA